MTTTADPTSRPVSAPQHGDAWVALRIVHQQIATTDSLIEALDNSFLAEDRHAAAVRALYAAVPRKWRLLCDTGEPEDDLASYASRFTGRGRSRLVDGIKRGFRRRLVERAIRMAEERR